MVTPGGLDGLHARARSPRLLRPIDRLTGGHSVGSSVSMPVGARAADAAI